MLYAKLNTGEEFTWHVGEKIPGFIYYAALEEGVKRLSADCDELDWILDNCKNLPLTSARSQNWFGDMATTILLGLPVNWRAQ